MTTFAPSNLTQQSGGLGSLYGARRSFESSSGGAALRDSGIDGWISSMISSMPRPIDDKVLTEEQEEREEKQEWARDMVYHSWFHAKADENINIIGSGFYEEMVWDVSEILQRGAQAILVDDEHCFAASVESILPPSILVGFL